MRNILTLIPGFALCLLIAMIAKVFGYYFPNLGSGLFAILIGIIIGNFSFTSHSSLKPGVKFSESRLLYYSIILLGATLTFGSLAEIGFSGIAFLLIQMGGTIFFVIWLGKKLGFSEDFRLLMASGNAVCGSSAIASTAPAINAKFKDMAVSITIVNLLGTVLMVILPLITNIVYNNDVHSSSALIGGTLQSVGQVVASGTIVGEEVKDQAAVFKISRIIFLALVVFLLKRMKDTAPEQPTEKEGAFKWNSIIPWYVAGFLLLCTINSLLVLPEYMTQPAKTIGNYMEIIALAGIGLSVKVKDLVQHGWKISGYATGIGIFQIALALLLIWICF